MPTLIDFHSMGKYTKDDLKMSQKEPTCFDIQGAEISTSIIPQVIQNTKICRNKRGRCSRPD